MFLGEYTNIKRLRREPSETKGGKYALKLISIKKLNEDEFLRSYLEGQIECMKEMDSPQIIKIQVFKEISDINPKFKNAFNRQISEKEFEGQFKESYRKSTIYIFGVLREALKNKTRKGNKLNYVLALLVISHAFNNIFSDTDNLREIFKEYLEEKKKVADRLDFSELRQWMSKSKEVTLNNIAKTIIKIYFQS